MELQTAEDQELPMPPEPEEPLPEDCCGTGCTPCVFDIYAKELALWEDQCKAIREGRDLFDAAPYEVSGQKSVSRKSNPYRPENLIWNTVPHENNHPFSSFPMAFLYITYEYVGGYFLIDLMFCLSLF